MKKLTNETPAQAEAREAEEARVAAERAKTTQEREADKILAAKRAEAAADKAAEDELEAALAAQKDGVHIQAPAILPPQPGPKDFTRVANPLPVNVRGDVQDEAIKTAVPFSRDAANIAETALAAKRQRFDPTNEAYLETRWLEFKRNLGVMGDWGSCTPTEKGAFARLVVTVTRDAQKEV